MKDWELHEGDCLEWIRGLDPAGMVLVTDPPYGISLDSGREGKFNGRTIDGDGSPALRDAVLEWAEAHSVPAIVLGSWRVPRPKGTRAVLTWEKGEHVGMGGLRLPWKPNTEEVYILGHGFTGPRRGSVLKHLAVAGTEQYNRTRHHPTEKPVSLMVDLIDSTPPGCTILDPFAGSGSTGVAALKTGRRFRGCEIDPKYARIARRRLKEAEHTLFPSRPALLPGQGTLFAEEVGT